LDLEEIGFFRRERSSNLLEGYNFNFTKGAKALQKSKSLDKSDMEHSIILRKCKTLSLKKLRKIQLTSLDFLSHFGQPRM